MGLYQLVLNLSNRVPSIMHIKVVILSNAVQTNDDAKIVFQQKCPMLQNFLRA
jgi:hypothetical protein